MKPPKNFKEYLRTVELPHDLWSGDGRLIGTLVSERDRKEAMRRFRRAPAPTLAWEPSNDGAGMPGHIKATIDGEGEGRADTR
jgi:hypothetical protein